MRKSSLLLFNQGRFEVADEIYAKDFVNHVATGDIGLKEGREAARGSRSAFPGLKMTVDKALVDGEFVTVLWSGEGTPRAKATASPPRAGSSGAAASRSGGSRGGRSARSGARSTE